MKNLETLIQELCPDGVEFVKLGEVCVVQRGKRLTKKQLSDSDKFPVFHGGIQPIGYYSEKNRDANTVMIINVGASAGTIGYSDKEFWSSDGCYCLSHVDSVVPKYIYYLLANNQHYFQAKVRHGGIPTLDALVVKNYEIPLPPIEVQTEIVRILDKFTSLEAELEAELDCRKRQYEYYRDKLLSFDNVGGQDVEWKKMNEVCVNCDSKRKAVTGAKRESGNIPYYGASGIVDYVKDYIFDGDYLLVSEDGANLLARNTPIAFSIKGKNWVNNHAHVLKFDNLTSQKFVEYYLNSICLSTWISGAAQPKLNQENLNRIPIPIPPLAEQHRIVAILDRFESLTTSLQSGLPAEIAARRQQYEHYRDKLLTFKRKGAV